MHLTVHKLKTWQILSLDLAYTLLLSTLTCKTLDGMLDSENLTTEGKHKEAPRL